MTYPLPVNDSVMSTLQSASRLAVSVVAVFLALRLTDDFVTGLGLAVMMAIVLDIPWWLYKRYTTQSE